MRSGSVGTAALREVTRTGTIAIVGRGEQGSLLERFVVVAGIAASAVEFEGGVQEDAEDGGDVRGEGEGVVHGPSFVE